MALEDDQETEKKLQVACEAAGKMNSQLLDKAERHGQSLVHLSWSGQPPPAMAYYPPLLGYESPSQTESRQKVVQGLFDRARLEQLSDFRAHLEKWELPLKAIGGIEIITLKTADGSVVGSLEPRELPLVEIADRCAGFRRNPSEYPPQDPERVTCTYGDIMKGVRKIDAAIDREVEHVRTRLRGVATK